MGFTRTLKSTFVCGTITDELRLSNSLATLKCVLTDTMVLPPAEARDEVLAYLSSGINADICIEALPVTKEIKFDQTDGNSTCRCSLASRLRAFEISDLTHVLIIFDGERIRE